MGCHRDNRDGVRDCQTTGMVPGTVTLMLFSETPVTIQTSLLCPMPTAISNHP